MTIKEPLSSYEDYCRVFAAVYLKHAAASLGSLYTCYVRHGMEKAIEGENLSRPKCKTSTDEDIVGIYIVRALIAQGMQTDVILEHTITMQLYVDNSDGDCTERMKIHIAGFKHMNESERKLYNRHIENTARYWWAKAGGPPLVE